MKKVANNDYIDSLDLRTRFVAEGIKSVKSFQELVLRTGSPPFETVAALVSELSESSLIPKFRGCGIELGSGLGLFGIAIKKLDKDNRIDLILALEGCEPYVTAGIGISVKEILRKSCIVPILGHFEKVPVKNNSLDFALQIESFHHAEDLTIAFKEAFRVLRPESFFVSIDRSWPNSVSNKTIEGLLNHEYSDSWKSRHGFEKDQVITRRDNGEHEIRDNEWLEAIQEAGFRVRLIKYLEPRPKLWILVKRILYLSRISLFFNFQVPPRPGIIRASINHLLGRNLFRSNVLISSHPRSLVVMILKK